MSLLLVIFAILLFGLIPRIMNLYAYPPDYFKSWSVIAVTALLSVNLLFCNFKQVTRILKTRQRFCPTGQMTDGVSVPRKSMQIVYGVLQRYGYKQLRLTGPGIFIVTKKRMGIWSSVVFHTGLLLICLGAFMELGFGFNGRIAMIPGQLFEDRTDNYKAIIAEPLFGRNEGKFSLFLHNISSKYKDDGVFAGGDISLITQDIGTMRQTVAEGSPLRFKMWGIYYESFGYYVKTRFTVGKQEFNLDVGLDTHEGENVERYSQNLDLQGTPYRITAEFVPDVSSLKISATRSYMPRHPVLSLIVVDNTNGKTVFNGFVPLGKIVNFDSNASVKFQAFYPWITFNAKMEPGLYVIYTGFFISLLGVGLIYLWVPEVLNVKHAVENSLPKLSVDGWTARYQKEFRHKMDNIEHELSELLQKEDLNESAT